MKDDGILRRIATRIKEGIGYEGDHRHAEVAMKDLGLIVEECRSSKRRRREERKES